MPYYGHGAGSIRTSIGDNWESGGPLRTPGHEQTWLFVVEGSLTANDTVLVRNGRRSL